MARKRQLITTKQQKTRLTLAKDMVKWRKKKLRYILCTDESTFTVTGTKPYYVRRPVGSDPYNPKFLRTAVKQPERIMVWGAIGYHAPGNLVILPRNETMNKERYKALLKNNLNECFKKCRIARRNGILLQDGATCHTAKIVKQYLEQNGIEYISPWPGNSPDLNPIEHVWAEMKRLLAARDTSSIPKLIAEIKDVWLNLDRNFIKDLIDSFPDRFREVIARNGKATSY